MDVIASAIHKCPFLNELALQHGNEYARHIAVQPTKPAGSCPPRPLFEEVDSFYTTFNLFHGKSGLVPLQKPTRVEEALPVVVHETEAFMHEQASSPPSEHRLCKPPPMFASMTLAMGAMPDPGKGPRDNRNQNKKQHNQNIRRNNRIRQERFKPISASASAAPGPSSGSCPMRQWLGPLAPVLFNGAKLQCPEFIIQMRAALARTEPVRQLRPQGLHVKLAAVGATAAVVNVPCGMVREHFDKFSVGWFLAVHASIPFVAMLRKAVIMPKWAIAMTVAAAIAGQVFGSRLERRRLTQVRANLDVAAPTQSIADRLVIVRTPSALTPAPSVPAKQDAAADKYSTSNRQQAKNAICPLKGVMKELRNAQDGGNHTAGASTPMFAHVSVPIRVS